MLEPLPARVDAVRAFLALFRPGLALDVVPIVDVYGPTGWDAHIQALVVSHETRGGADASACPFSFCALLLCPLPSVSLPFVPSPLCLLCSLDAC